MTAPNIDGTESYLEWAREIEANFCQRANLSDRRFYKIFYSKIQPSRLMVLFENPGGESAGTDKRASEYYENGEHDMVHYRNTPSYALAGPLFNYLSHLTDDVASVPMTNVIWHRSRRAADLRVPSAEAAEIAMPGLTAMLQRVTPEVILCTNGSFKLFKRLYLSNVKEQIDEVTTPNGVRPARIFSWCNASLDCTGSHVRVIRIGHASKYASRKEWATVIQKSVVRCL